MPFDPPFRAIPINSAFNGESITAARLQGGRRPELRNCTAEQQCTSGFLCGDKASPNLCRCPWPLHRGLGGPHRRHSTLNALACLQSKRTPLACRPDSDGDVRVDLRRLPIRVPEQCLHGPQILARFQHRRGEVMTEDIRHYSFANARHGSSRVVTSRTVSNTIRETRRWRQNQKSALSLSQKRARTNLLEVSEPLEKVKALLFC